MTKDELAKVVSDIIIDHEVTIRYEGWDEEHPYCRSCAYLGSKEDPALHTANVVLEYLHEYYKEQYENE